MPITASPNDRAARTIQRAYDVPRARSPLCPSEVVAPSDDEELPTEHRELRKSSVAVVLIAWESAVLASCITPVKTISLLGFGIRNPRFRVGALAFDRTRGPARSQDKDWPANECL